MYKKLALVSAMSFAAFSAHADIVGGNVDAAYWGANAAGDYNVAGEQGDLEKDFGLEDDTSMFLSVAVEHPVPLLPNVRLGYTSINQAGNGTLSSSFNGQPASADVSSEWGLDMVDGTAYYEILDNWVNVDVGLTLRQIDSTMTLDSTAGKSVQEVEATLPLVYGRVQGDMPFTGWSVGAELNAISFDGDSVTDANAYIQYETFEVLHARLGYRTLDISVSDNGQSVDGDVSGAYLGLGIDF